VVRKIWEFPVFKQMGCNDTYKARAPQQFQILDGVTTFSNEKVGHVDMLVQVGGDEFIAFEVKSFIPSLGDVIRQVRHYQAHLPITYVIVSPDVRFRSQIEAQGVRFLEYVSAKPLPQAPPPTYK
jgi:hypothetical protein